nr:FAD binding domain-containing protein [Actinomadura madurae]
MKPPPFGYHAPATLAEALDALAAAPGGKVLAGGQSLIPLLNMRLAAPSDLVDINRVAGLDTVHVGDGGVRVGALARHARVERSAEAAAVQPLLGQALRHVAHPVIRNRGTVVGSLAHADPAAELPAVLAVLGGTVEAASARGRRTIPAAAFFRGPLEPALEPGELAVAAFFPAAPPRTGTAFAETARRHGDYALSGVAAVVGLDEDLRVREARAGLPRHRGDAARARPGRRRGAGRRLGGRRRPRPGADRPGARHPRGRRVPAAPDRRAHRARPERGGRRGAAEGGGLMEEGFEVALTVNGTHRAARVPARRLLSDLLRHDLGLTGTHVGCEHGVCGCCTVLLDGEPVRSCLMFAVTASGHEVTTVEGLAAPDGTPSPVQRAFRECHGLQCGFCTPGFLCTVTALLRETPRPTDDQVLEGISGNLCRCTGYQNIVKSVHRAADLLDESGGAEGAPPRRETAEES